jgi:enediyne biosynthesis protein CalE3
MSMDQRLLLMHQSMLADKPRMTAYDHAIEQAVGAGDIVADVGAGTLALSILALRHGAGHAYAIEADPQMAELAVAIAERNDLKGRLTVIQGDARRVRLPVQADVIVSEMMGNLGPEEQMMEVLGTFARRNLKPGGRVVPQRLVTELAAIEFDAEGWGLWSDSLGYQLDAVQDRAEPTAQLHFFQRRPTLLSRPVLIADHRIGTGSPRSHQRRDLRITTPGRLHAVAGYFTATLVPGVTLSNFPSYPGCNWAVWIWPLRHTMVGAGDVVQVRLHRPDEVRDAMRWRLTCAIGRKGRL